MVGRMRASLSRLPPGALLFFLAAFFCVVGALDFRAHAQILLSQVGMVGCLVALGVALAFCDWESRGAR